jgi:hypothetical protein
VHAQEPDRDDDDHDRHDHGREQERPPPGELGRPVDAPRRHVADQREAGRPQAGPEDAVRDERAVAHPGAAGDERGEGADQADEATDQDRLAAVAGEVALDLREALRSDPHPRPVSHHKPAPEPAAEQKAGGVASPRGHPHDRDRQIERGGSLAGDRASEDDDGLARGDEADERARLEERERPDQQVRPGAERVGDVPEQLLEVDVREQALDHEVGGDRRGDDHQQPEAVVAQRDPHR